MAVDPNQSLKPLLLNELMESSPQGFLAFDRTGSLVLCEGAAEQIIGRPKSGLLGLKAAEIPLIGSVASELMDRIGRGRSAVSYYDLEFPGATRDMVRSLDVHASLAPSFDGVVMTLHPRGQAVGRTAPSGERSLMLTHLSTALAHEIKNPLSGIRAAAQLAALSLPENKAHLTQMITAETERLSTLVDQLQGLTDRQAVGVTPVNLHQTIDHVCTVLDGMLAQTTHLRLKFDPSLPLVLGNADALIQILLNLIINAQEAAQGERVDILVETRYRQGFQITREGSAQKALPIEIEISDTGPGVPAELEGSLFDPFVTTKEGGRGLGLAIVALLIEDIGAHIRYERSEPQGARFLINLVRAQ